MSPESKIPMADLVGQTRTLEPRLMEAVRKVLLSGSYIIGPEVKTFESEMAEYLGVEFAIGVNSGTDALVIALRAAGIGKGDEVLTTPFTFFATAEAISQVGATPVFLDVEPDTFNLDVNLIPAAITDATKAILPVHLFGHAVDMDPLLKLADESNLKVIEDVAQALGGSYDAKKLGSIGDASAFSFFPSKNLGAFGDAGLIATNDADIAASARMLRAHGASRKYYNEVLGYNSRLDEIHAALLRIKLEFLDEWNERRLQVGRRYASLLEDIPWAKAPVEAGYADHVFHQYTIQVPAQHRDAISQYLQEHGVATAVYYPVPVHQLPIYKDVAPSLPVAERLAGEVLSLPIWPEMDEATQDRVVETLASALPE
jgi:dTDP-4-amino-4,6-dideoxygalactose transaminase